MELCEDIRHTVEMKAGLTFACMNLKKLAKMKAGKGLIGMVSDLDKFIYAIFMQKTRKGAVGK